MMIANVLVNGTDHDKAIMSLLFHLFIKAHSASSFVYCLLFLSSSFPQGDEWKRCDSIRSSIRSPSLLLLTLVSSPHTC